MGKKSSENGQSTGHFQSVFFFLNISRTNSKTSKVNQHMFKSLNILYISCIGQSLLTVVLSKMHKQNLKNKSFFPKKQIYLESADKIK